MHAPKNYSHLFLDMNAFFASVEQQVQPSLRGKPVGVAPYTGANGCVIAKSYEAKAFGVKTGNLVSEAKNLCPQIIILEARPELYMFYHRQIHELLESFTPFAKVLSVDEFDITLTGLDRNREASLKMAQNIKRKILEKIGDWLFCSVGIGPNSWLAKVAGELKKPDGLVTVTLNDLPKLYSNLKLIDLPGINLGMMGQLALRGIRTPSNFFAASLFDLSRWFGHPGRVWFYRLRGYEIDERESATKSISHQHVLAPKYRTFSSARAVLIKLAEKCATRLRAQKLSCGGVGVSISFLNAPRWAHKITTDLISDSQNIRRLALNSYDACKVRGTPLKVAVVLFNLQRIQNEQISLFLDLEKSKKISKTLDEINDKYGPDSIYPAAMFDTSDAAPTRISFGNPNRLK